MNGTEADVKIHDKAMREIKAKRHLAEMELHTTMQLTNQVSVMKVMGGWIYINSISPTNGWACFVPEKS